VKPRRVDWYAVDWLDGVATMPPDQRGVYDTIINLIYAHGDDDGGIEYTEHELAIRCCCHWRELRRILAALLARGKVAHDGRRIYVTRCAEELHKASNRVARAAQNAAKRWNNNGLANADASETSIARARTIQQPSNNKQQSTSTPKRATFALEFAEWWKVYPEKTGKKAAFVQFNKARQEVELSVLIDGVRRYIAAKPTDRHWKNPATWLHQGCWLDEPSSPAANGHDKPAGPPPRPFRIKSHFADCMCPMCAGARALEAQPTEEH
jgi:uncharacterized protein YdaU (DUF1376 family)